MKYSCRALLLSLALWIDPLAAGARSSVSFFCAGKVISLLDSADAAAVSIRSDVYTREQTSFDRAIRLDKPKGLTEADYLRAAAKNVRTWPTDEQIRLRMAFAAIDSFAGASGLNLHLPDTVKVIKTTAAEEFGAEGFTRENRIMLNTAALPVGTHVLAHELWHVISRMNKPVRDEAYAAFHFRPCNNIIYKPAFKGRVITNPDCPFLMHYIRIDDGGKPLDVTIVLYSKDPYQPGASMDKYVNIALLALTGDDKHKKPMMKNGKPVTYQLMEKPDFLKQVGKNTQYLLHVEEIAAEHFAALVTGMQLPQMEYVEGMRKALR